MTRIVNSAIVRRSLKLGGVSKLLPTGPPKDMKALAEVAKREKRFDNRLHSLGWRSPREYKNRQILAWCFNICTLLAFLFVSLVYALKFGNQETKNMVVAWLMAYGITFAVVEPFQVFLLACAPCLFDEATRFGRFCGRCRFVYNELCAP